MHVAMRGFAEALDEDELVRAARRGDRIAFGELYSRHARMVHGILLARVPKNTDFQLFSQHSLMFVGTPRWIRTRRSERQGPPPAWMMLVFRRYTRCGNCLQL